MGVERAVTRWYALRQSLGEEITRLEAKLAEPLIVGEAQDPSVQETTDLPSVQKELAEAQERLRLLGPCPQPMMG